MAGVLAAICATGVSGQSPVPRASSGRDQKTLASVLFARYLTRDFDGAKAGLRDVDDWQLFLDDAREHAKAWPPTFAAAFLLEASTDRLNPGRVQPLKTVGLLLDLGWSAIDRADVSAAFKRAWFLAALARLEGVSVIERPDVITLVPRPRAGTT